MIGKIQNASISIGDSVFHGITVIYHSYSSDPTGNYLCANDRAYKMLDEELKKHRDIAPKGSSIYLMNEVPVDINVIRRCYTIKRKPEDADYIVYGALKSIYHSEWLHDNCFYKDKKLLISNRNLSYDDIKEIEAEYGITTYDNPEHHNYITIRWIPDRKENLVKFFKGEFTKPLVNYKDLDVSFGEDLNTDIIDLTYKLGIADFKKGSVDNLLLNLKTLNNYNWQKYSYTLHLLFKMMKRDSFSSFNELMHYKSRLPKIVSSIINSCYLKRDFLNRYDLELAQNMLIKMMDIKDLPIFVSVESLARKIVGIGLSIDDFEKVFGVVARINIKEYVETKNEDSLSEI